MGGITARTGRLRSSIINNTYPTLYDRARFDTSEPTITFLSLLTMFFSGRRSVRIVSFLSDNYKK